MRKTLHAPALCGLFLVLAGCAGDTRETTEPHFRRDAWDVQIVEFSAQPAGVPSWCRVENDQIAMNIPRVPGRAVLPLRGTELRTWCWNTRGMTGQTVLEREETGRWPALVDIRLQPDPRMAEASPGQAAIAPFRTRTR